MRLEVVLPKWGMTMQDGTIVEWTVAVGDSVTEGDTIANVETEKIEAEVPAPATGTVSEIVVAEGETIDVGTVIAYMETE